MKISSFTIDHIFSAQSMITFHYWSFVVIIITFEQHWYHCHNFIFISSFNWTNINFISNFMNFSKNIKSQMTFASLNVEELITLKNEVAKKYEISLKKKRKAQNEKRQWIHSRIFRAIFEFNYAFLYFEKQHRMSKHREIVYKINKIYNQCEYDQNFLWSDKELRH
jgi:hypothetical protein